MSNFSDIGFNIETEQDFRNLIEKAYEKAHPVKAANGKYMLYTDDSGAELWIPFNNRNEFIGANPHYRGKSKRMVCLTSIIEREESELDGAFHAWADPAEENNPDTGAYPFVFDIPDFRTIGKIEMPQNFELQLTAFAHELDYYDSEQAYDESQSEPKFAVQSFIPSGLFSPEGNDTQPPEALGIFTGIIKDCERKTNSLTGEEFYWLLVDTLGGEVDVVADIKFFTKNPHKKGVVQGQFWLSGRLVNPPKFKKKGFFRKLFGK